MPNNSKNNGSASKAPVLRHINPADKSLSSGDKAQDKARVQALAEQINTLQDIFWADKRHKLLVVLQGTDTSGKDGTLRAVFNRTTPLGVKTVGWKAPSSDERAHDFLWRIHQQVPASGEIVVFNRSHYEDVLVPVVKSWITPKQTQQRYAHINDFERMLTETGTVILKFMLHISKEEQRIRLQERVDDPDKNWKFDEADLEARLHWDDYQAAYAALLQATHTEWAPWTVVPADSKTQRNLMIATHIRDTLAGLKLRYPPQREDLKGLKIV